MHDRHIENKELVLYINGKVENKDIVRAIESHIYIMKCGLCKDKLDGLIRLNTVLRENGKIESQEEDITVCPYANNIDDFIKGRMNKDQKEDYFRHLAECDDCRELSAVLHVSGHLQEETDRASLFSWELLKNGIFRLTKDINYRMKDTLDSFYTPAPAVSAGKFRGDAADENSKIEISLPDDCGSLKLLYRKISESTGKIAMEVTETDSRDMLIELYDDSGILLKSVDGKGAITCSIAKGRYKLLINKRFEVPLHVQ